MEPNEITQVKCTNGTITGLNTDPWGTLSDLRGLIEEKVTKFFPMETLVYQLMKHAHLESMLQSLHVVLGILEFSVLIF